MGVYVETITIRLRQELHAITVAVRHTQGSDAKVFREFLNSLVSEDD
jgi:hypothetical protein